MGETKTDFVYNDDIFIKTKKKRKEKFSLILTKRWQQSQINIMMTTVSQICDIIWQKKKKVRAILVCHGQQDEYYSLG